MAVNLRIPGPTPVPEEIREAGAQPMINHRGPEFRDILSRVTQRLKDLFLTKNDLFILTASGTGAMEAAVVNTLSPGDKVLAVSIGEFGERFIQIAKAYGANVQAVHATPGTAIDPAEIRKALKADPSIKAVLVTHNETSTGVTNDLAAISGIVKGEFGKLLVVDAISSIGSISCPVDAWDLDVVASGSQKGWMAPPGLSFVSISQRGWQAQAQAKIPRYYFDLATAKRYLERGETPWTPAVSIFYSLDTALEILAKEGLENILSRHARMAQLCRNGVKELGLQLLADEKVASNTVTCVRVPEGVQAAQLIELLRKEYALVLGGGQGSLSGKIFRIGHLGHCTDEDMRNVMESLESALPRVGFHPAVTRSQRR